MPVLVCHSSRERITALPTTLPAYLFGRQIIGWLLSILLLLPPPLVAAPTADEVRVGVLINLVRFISWPPEVLPPAAPFQLCITEQAPLTAPLRSAVTDRSIGGHPLQLRSVDPMRERVSDCHLIYFDGRYRSPPPQFQGLSDVPILSVGEGEGFVQSGMIGITVEAERLRLLMRLQGLYQARLQPDPRLLTLVTVVDSAAP